MWDSPPSCVELTGGSPFPVPGSQRYTWTSPGKNLREVTYVSHPHRFYPCWPARYLLRSAEADVEVS